MKFSCKTFTFLCYFKTDYSGPSYTPAHQNSQVCLKIVPSSFHTDILEKLFGELLTDIKLFSLCMSLSVCLPGVPQVTVNTEVDVLSHGAPSTVTAPTVATEEQPATAVSK